MSKNQPVVEACRLAFTGFEKNQMSALRAVLSPDLVFEFPKSLPYGGTFRGLDEFNAFWVDLYTNYYDHFHYDAHAVLDAGSHVVVPVIARAKAKNGRTMENEHCFLFEVKAGKIVYGRIYADTAKGRDAIEGLAIHPSRASS